MSLQNTIYGAAKKKEYYIRKDCVLNQQAEKQTGNERKRARIANRGRSIDAPPGG
ncbi:hypothetical protein KDK_65350 [Dictyobacter kobayashii]|uniref:Uncharacterized protein n=1 Tax=Dictyobacter kobayashii TaxID=2014872 RepID=A0A402AUJ0_9CHLR|nr:hypothetical protein KDK_65350 [Dictyobacter kobayashii]